MTILKGIGRGNIPVIAHPDIFRLNFISDPMLRHVGVIMADASEKLEEAGAILYLTRSPLQLLPGLSTTVEVPRKTDFEEVGIALQTIEDGLVKEDTIPDDIPLAALKVRSIMAGHCTGFRAQADLYQTFKDNFQPLQTGNIFEI